MAALKTVFWTCFVLVCYTYVGYGLLLWLLVGIKRLVKGKPEIKGLPTDEALPHVTFMVCAFNEEDVVEMKMKNINELDYPQDRLHVMWVTDGSTDHTNERLAEYEGVEDVARPLR